MARSIILCFKVSIQHKLAFCPSVKKEPNSFSDFAIEFLQLSIYMLLNTEEMWKAHEVLYYFLTIHKMSNNKSSEMFSMSKQNSSSF